MFERNKSVQAILEYNTDLFDEATIARMACHLTVLLEGIVKQPEQLVHQLPMLTDAEYQRIVHEWNDTSVDFGKPQTIHALFEEQVDRTPDAIAVVFDGQQIIYRELNERANQLAHYLIKKGVEPDVMVGIAIERSLEMMIGVLGILKAGGAYVPFDPTYPEDRLRFMLEDANVRLLVTTDSVAKMLPKHMAEIVPLDHDMFTMPSVLPLFNPVSQTLPDNLAYVLYTSGSTGTPKAVTQTHHTLHNFVLWQQKESNALGRTLQFAPINFDISVQEFFTTLCVGGTLVMIDPEVRRDPFALLDYLKSQAINRLFIPFTPLQQLAEVADGTMPSTLKEVIQCGEALQITTEIKNWFRDSQCILFNHYGPTESHVVTSYRLPRTLEQWVNRPPIGCVVANTDIYILDENMIPASVGIPGELYIGGSQLARGYLNRPNLTAERFIDHPEFGRLYKTGDLCRWLAASRGNIEFIGRTDFQVKIRGFRIELGEIEHALLAQEGVLEAVVLAREEKDSDKRLVAYMVRSCKGAELVDSATLRTALQQTLPDYMIPSAFVFLEAMPLTPNGKLDRQALPAPNYAVTTNKHVPAETFDETRLVMVWQDVLGVQPVGVTDNFFELGGHSLLATQLVQRMRQTLQRDISLRQVFSTPTIRGLWQSMDDRQTDTTSFVPLRLGDDAQTPFFIFHAASGVVFPFATLLPYLPVTQPVYALQARGIYDNLPPFESLEALATQTIGEMKRIQPHGPYTIGGWSFGGMVAFEIARQLKAQGDEVTFLGIIDVYPQTDAQTANEEEPTAQEELQIFFYLLGDIISVDYRNLDSDLFERATEQDDPVGWLLDQMSEQGVPPAMDPAIVKRIWVTTKHNSQLMQAYQPQPYDGAITLFCAEESAPEDGPQHWQALTPQPVDTVWVSGGHYTMLNVEYVERLGRTLSERLKAIDRCNHHPTA